MAACIPLLHLCQEQKGYVDEEIMHFVSHRLDLSPAHVKGVVTFYTLFNRSRSASTRCGSAAPCPAPSAARTTSSTQCEKQLGIHVGETTQRRQGHAAHGRVPRELRHRAHDAGGQGVLREPHARAGRRDPRRSSSSDLSRDARRMISRCDYLTKVYGKPNGWSLETLRARVRGLQGRRGACSRR